MLRLLPASMSAHARRQTEIGDCAIMTADLRKHRLGWIGLGRMGYAMAERLAKADADVRGYNRTRAKAEALVESGVAGGPAVRPAECDIVFTMVSTSDDSNRCLLAGMTVRLPDRSSKSSRAFSPSAGAAAEGPRDARAASDAGRAGQRHDAVARAGAM
jgi:phosphoglycerate dehydrogenase-like enzyme